VIRGRAEHSACIDEREGEHDRGASLGQRQGRPAAVFLRSMVLYDPFVGLTGGRSDELASAYLCIAILLLALGSGRLSADANIFFERG